MRVHGIQLLRLLSLAAVFALAACGGAGSSGNQSGTGSGNGINTIAGGAASRVALQPAECANMLDQPYVTRTALVDGRFTDDAELMLRFVHITDIHIIDDDGAAVIGFALTDPLVSRFSSAMRLQAEYADEVLNSMIAGINACDEKYPSAFAMITGDSADITTVAETRRVINNLDGTYDQMSNFEAECIKGLRNPTPAKIKHQCRRYTGRLVADAQTPGLRPNSDLLDALLGPQRGSALDPLLNPLLQASLGPLLESSLSALLQRRLPVTRTVLQFLATTKAALEGGTAFTAPGLPPKLRCNWDQPGCANVKLSMPYLVAFGNHDAYLRGTVPFEAPLNVVARVFGRQYLITQHAFIEEFFYTTPKPGPIGHGFNFVPESRWTDGDPRNDGYYSFTTGNGRFRMIVLNTVIDGQHGTPPGQLVVNPFALADGTIYREQFRWLKKELRQAYKHEQLVIIFSHHPDVSFADSGTFSKLAPVGITGPRLDRLLASWPHVIAWVAGHTHRNRIRAFKVEHGIGSNGAITVQVDCKVPGECEGFWQIETSSLIDYPQQARMIEIFNNGDGTGTIRATMLTHRFEVSRKLARIDNRCQFYLDDPQAVAAALSDAGMHGICTQGGTRTGQPEDRNVNLIFPMPSFEELP